MSTAGAERPGLTPAVASAPATIQIMVAKVGRAHGLRGDVFLDVRTDEPDRRFAPGSTFTTGRGVLVLESTRWHGARLLARFAHSADREGAELLHGIELWVDVPANQRPDDPEEFYDHQLRGLAAHLVGGDRLGTVRDVLHLPGQDMLVLDVAGMEVLVPFVADIVTSVDLGSGRIEIADRPGLLSEPEDGTAS